MTAAQLLKTARADGVQFVIKEARLHIKAAPQISAKWVPILRPHKADLQRLVAQEQGQNIAQNGPFPTGAHTANASPNAMAGAWENPNHATDWQALRDAYYSHHQHCPACICAGRGYGLRCGAGSSLWAAYIATPPPLAHKRPRLRDPPAP